MHLGLLSLGYSTCSLAKVRLGTEVMLGVLRLSSVSLGQLPANGFCTFLPFTAIPDGQWHPAPLKAPQQLLTQRAQPDNSLFWILLVRVHRDMPPCFSPVMASVH
eukprot:3784321-Rhodomonas_salina.1